MSIATLTPLRGEADTAHAGMLDQLDAVRQFIAAHPSFPVTSTAVSASGDATIWKLCTTAAEVDAIAAGIGIAARWRSATQYAARLPIGPGFCYEVAYIGPREAQDQDPAGREMAGAAA